MRGAVCMLIAIAILAVTVAPVRAADWEVWTEEDEFTGDTIHVAETRNQYGDALQVVCGNPRYRGKLQMLIGISDIGSVLSSGELRFMQQRIRSEVISRGIRDADGKIARLIDMYPWRAGQFFAKDLRVAYGRRSYSADGLSKDSYLEDDVLVLTWAFHPKRWRDNYDLKIFSKQRAPERLGFRVTLVWSLPQALYPSLSEIETEATVAFDIGGIADVLSEYTCPGLRD